MPRKYNNGEWSLGRFNSFITSVLRGGSRRWGPKWQCLASAKTEKKINVKTGRLAQHYRCAMCQEEFTAKDVEVDHILPIASGKEDQTWDDFINLLFCEADNLQVLDKVCHKKKTQQEKKK